jgi:hypothetical protein
MDLSARRTCVTRAVRTARVKITVHNITGLLDPGVLSAANHAIRPGEGVRRRDRQAQASAKRQVEGQAAQRRRRNCRLSRRRVRPQSASRQGRPGTSSRRPSWPQATTGAPSSRRRLGKTRSNTQTLKRSNAQTLKRSNSAQTSTAKPSSRRRLGTTRPPPAPRTRRQQGCPRRRQG